jgi:hypothetical protein
MAKMFIIVKLDLGIRIFVKKKAYMSGGTTWIKNHNMSSSVELKHTSFLSVFTKQSRVLL